MIYRQTRVGQNGRLFTLYKFNTMRDDGTVTHPLIRRFSLNELPQLWNIIKGDMRLFGPRPELPEVHEQCVAAMGEVWTSRLRAKPGLLSLAVVGCPELRAPERYSLGAKFSEAVLDNTMIDDMNLRIRMKILCRVPRVIMKGQTA